jgi:tRNA(Met) C34 N-acetyltransferase TmcA
LEGEISKPSIAAGMQRGKRASGDMIPWTVAQQFQDQDFPSLSGARIVRIATHSDYQGVSFVINHWFLNFYNNYIIVKKRWDMDQDQFNYWKNIMKEK